MRVEGVKRVGKEREVGFLRLKDCEEGKGEGRSFSFRLSKEGVG